MNRVLLFIFVVSSLVYAQPGPFGSGGSGAGVVTIADTNFVGKQGTFYYMTADSGYYTYRPPWTLLEADTSSGVNIADVRAEIADTSDALRAEWRSDISDSLVAAVTDTALIRTIVADTADVLRGEMGAGTADSTYEVITATDSLKALNVARIDSSLGIGMTPTTASARLLIESDSTDTIELYRYSGDDNQCPNVLFFRGRGPHGTPTAVLQNDVLGSVGFRGYYVTGGPGWSGSRAYIAVNAAENWTSTAQGTYIRFATNAIGAVAASERMRLSHNGVLIVGSDGHSATPTGQIQVRTDNPEFAIESSTAEDGAAGRDVYIKHYGLTAGSVRHSLGYLRFSHYSTGADQKGQFDLCLNQTADGTSPAGLVFSSWFNTIAYTQFAGYVGIGKIPTVSLDIVSTDDTIGFLSSNPASTNTILPTLKLERITSGTAANGIGLSINSYIEDSAGNSDLACINEVTYTDATSTSEDADVVWRLMAAGTAPVASTTPATPQMKLSSVGKLTLSGSLSCSTAGGQGVYATATNGSALYGSSSSGQGAYLLSATSTAVFAGVSNGGLPCNFVYQGTSNNTVVQMTKLQRDVNSGVGATGEGIGTTTYLEDSAGNSDLAATEELVYSDATSTSEDADRVWRLQAGGTAAVLGTTPTIPQMKLTSTGNLLVSSGLGIGTLTPQHQASIVSSTPTLNIVDSDVNLQRDSAAEASDTSSVKIDVSTAFPTMTFSGGDGDQVAIGGTTSDQLTITGASGGVLVSSFVNTFADTSNDGAGHDHYGFVCATINAYVDGLRVCFKAATANVGACTLQINALGTKALKTTGINDPADDYIEIGTYVDCIYDGTQFQLLSPDANP